MERQALNVFRMRLLGAEVITSVTLRNPPEIFEELAKLVKCVFNSAHK